MTSEVSHEELNQFVKKRPRLQRFDGEVTHNNYPNIIAYVKDLESYVTNLEAKFLPLARKLDNLIKDQKETDRLLKLEAKMIADDMDRMEKIIETQAKKLDRFAELLKNFDIDKIQNFPKQDILNQIRIFREEVREGLEVMQK